MGYYLDIKRNKILINVALSTDHENVILTQRWPTKMPVTALLPLYRKFTVEKSREINRHILVLRLGLRTVWTDCIWHVISSWDDANVWELEISEGCIF